MNSSTEKSCLATLRIASKAMNASDISQVMGIEPSRSYNIGEVISLRSPQPRIREESLWLLESGAPEEKTLEEHLEKILLLVGHKSSELDQLAEKCDIEVIIGFTSFNGQGGFVLSHELSEKMARSKIDFVFDLYFIEGND